LGQQLAAYDAAHPGLRGIVLAGHKMHNRPVSPRCTKKP
jgi:hypothetical protein